MRISKPRQRIENAINKVKILKNLGIKQVRIGSFEGAIIKRTNDGWL
jgi:hypothetical protein